MQTAASSLALPAFIQPVEALQNSLLARMNEAMDSQHAGFHEIADIYAKTHVKVQQAPGKYALNSVDLLLHKLEKLPRKALYRDLPKLSFFGVGFDAAADAKIEAMTYAWGQLDAPEAATKYDREILLKHGALVGRTDWEYERLHMYDPKRYPKDDATVKKERELVKTGELKSIIPETEADQAIAILNSYRWQLPWVINPGIQRTMETLDADSMGIPIPEPNSYLPELREPDAPVWQTYGMQMPEHIFQDPDDPAHPWQEETPGHAFQMQGFLELSLSQEAQNFVNLSSSEYD